MYNLCIQDLQNHNSAQQKLFILQPLKDMFQMLPRRCRQTWICQPLVQPGVVTALTRPESPRLLFVNRVYEHNPQTISAAIRAILTERGVQEGHWELC